MVTDRAKATVLMKYSGTDRLPKPPVVLIENFRMAGDVITSGREPTSITCFTSVRSATRDELISQVQKGAHSAGSTLRSESFDVPRVWAQQSSCGLSGFLYPAWIAHEIRNPDEQC